MRKKFILCFLLNIKNNGKEMNVIIIDNGKGINGSELNAPSLITNSKLATSKNNGIGTRNNDIKKIKLEKFLKKIIPIASHILIYKLLNVRLRTFKICSE
jgi:hypothetical protein